MYKNVALILCSILCFLYTSVSIYAAGGSCPVESKSAEVLENYIKDLRKVISNITNEVATNKPKSSQKVDEKLSTDWDDMKRIYNEMVDWDGFYTSFEYYAIFPISNELPYQISRDHNRIKKESDGLRKYLRNIVKKGYGDIKIENACNGVGEPCELSGTSMEIVGELIQNTSSLTDLFKKTVLSKDTSTHKAILFTGKDFRTFRLELNKHYGPQALEACSNIEGGFFDTIKNAIAKIDFKNQAYKDGVKKWKEGWDLLVRNTSDREYYQREKILLEEELARQGVSSENKKQILKNLDDYNSNGGFSKNNNPLTNSFNTLAESISSSWNNFKETLAEAFPKDEEQVSIKDFQEKYNENEISLEIERNIARIYNTEKPFVEIQDDSTADVRLRIIKLHNSISQSINVLQDTIKVSQKVCNKQDSGNGKCN